MSATTDSRPKTVQQRSVDATRHLCQVLGLDDLKLLATALAEAAADEASWNQEFAERIKSLYRELAQLNTRPRPTGRKKERPELIPIAIIEDAKFNPYGPVDPFYQLKLYGKEQLPAALDRFTAAKLRESAKEIERRYPGTRLGSKATKSQVIDYIVEHVAGPGH